MNMKNNSITVWRIIFTFCGVSFLLAINKTSKLSNYILHQFEGLHKLWDTPIASVLYSSV